MTEETRTSNAPESPQASSGRGSPPSPELLTTREVGALLNMGASTVRAHDRRGLLPPPVRIGGSVRWLRKELLAWLAVGCPSRGRWIQMGKSPADRISRVAT